MQCAEFEQQLNAVLDDRRSPTSDSRLTAHAAECPQCRDLLDEHVAMLRGLQCSVTPALKRDFSRRVVHAARPCLPPTAPAAMRRRWLKAGPFVAAAAAMLLAVTVGWYAYATRDPGASAPELIFGSHAQAGGLAIATNVPGTAKSSNSAGGANWLFELPRLPSRWRAYRNALAEISVPSWHLEEMEQLAPGIRPLRASVAVIWDAIRRTIPSSQVDAPPHPDAAPTTSWNFDRPRVA